MTVSGGASLVYRFEYSYAFDSRELEDGLALSVGKLAVAYFEMEINQGFAVKFLALISRIGNEAIESTGRSVAIDRLDDDLRPSETIDGLMRDAIFNVRTGLTINTTVHHRMAPIPLMVKNGYLLEHKDPIDEQLQDIIRREAASDE